MSVLDEATGAVADAIELEMRRVGWWSARRPDESRFVGLGAPFYVRAVSQMEHGAVTYR